MGGDRWFFAPVGVKTGDSVQLFGSVRDALRFLYAQHSGVRSEVRTPRLLDSFLSSRRGRLFLVLLA